MDAIERAGTIEADAVIDALECISIETSSARKFAFTPGHDGSYQSIIVFQWQNGEMIPIYPQKIMEEAGATYTFPDWPGPWDKIS